MLIQKTKKRVVAEEELPVNEPEVEVEVEPEAADLLFEAEDVAEILAEVTGEPVEVTADENAAVFSVGDEEFTVEAEGDEEIVEARKKEFKGKKTIGASVRRPASRPITRKRRFSK